MSLSHFEKYRDELDSLLTDAVRASEAAIGVLRGWQGHWGAFHHARVIVNCGTMLQIVSGATDARQGERLLDHFSVASVARTAIEAQLMMLYVSDPTISADVWELRRQVFHLHDTIHRIRMFKPTSTPDGGGAEVAQMLFDLRFHMERQRSEVAALPEFQKLTEAQKERILSGQDFYVGGLRAAVKSVGWEVTEFEFYSTYLSAYIHSSPVSFFRADAHGIDFANVSEFQYALCGTAFAAVSNKLPQLTERMQLMIAKERG